MKRRANMAKRTTTPRKASTKKRKKKQKASDNLRQTLYGFGLWALGIINALLIASFIYKHISSGDEQVLSLEEPVQQTRQAVTQKIARLKLEVLNGCGEQGIAKKFADYLQQAGFKPVSVGNFDNFDMPNTMILDRKSKNRRMGLRVAESLGLSSTFVRYLASEDHQVDVTVIIGKDYPKVDFLRLQK